MKRSILIPIVLFAIAGLLDFIVFKNRVEPEDIYQIIKDLDGNEIEKPYKINGKFLRFEKSCNTINFSDYKLITSSGDTIYPKKDIMIRKDEIVRPHFIFENLDKNSYCYLMLIHNDTTSYLSKEISILESKTLSYFELIPYFDNFANELVMDNFDSTLPLIINYKTDINDCPGYSFKFYYKGKDLFVDYHDYDNTPNNNNGFINRSHKVKSEIFDKIEYREFYLKPLNKINNANNEGLTVNFFHRNSIKTYHDRINSNAFHRKLLNDIDRYRID